ncbi:MAG: alpha-glucosidase C-terminal domain-containing protein, partial [Clostridia bacterium]|nr:alpha-glucosidase C-terminal domain-containing protein [Clostridia bacterium]
RTVPQVFPITAPGSFSWNQEAGKVVVTTFYPYQWDLNYANPAVFRDMTDNMLFLCNRGVDILRLDAVPYIWKELGTSCRNLPQVHSLVRMMRMACEIVCPGTLLLGEVVMEPSKVTPYFGTMGKPECHMLYNVTTMASTWHTVATKDVRLLRHQLGQVFTLPKQYVFLNYLRCHDDIGWGLDFDFLGKFGMTEVPHKKYLNDYFQGFWPGSNARGELYNDDPKLGDARLCGTTASLLGLEPALESGVQAWVDHVVGAIETLHAFLLTQSGIPVLYSGDELAQINDWSYHDDPLKADDSRYLHRGNFDWNAAAHRHDTSTPAGAVYEKLQTLRALRAEHAVFSADADVWTLEPNNDHVLGIGRFHQKEKLLALFNFSQDPETVWLPEGEDFTDLLTGEECKADVLTLPGCGFRWLWKRYP